MNYTARSELAIGALVAAFGAFLLFAYDVGTGVPERGQLEQISGPVSWSEKHRHGVRFGLVGDARLFDYSFRMSSNHVVTSALQSAGLKQLTVFFDPSNPKGPIYSGKKYFSVWEVHVEGNPVGMYEETTKAWANDDKIARWLGAVFLIGGIVLAIHAIRKPRAPQQGTPGDSPRPPGSAAPERRR